MIIQALIIILVNTYSQMISIREIQTYLAKIIKFFYNIFMQLEPEQYADQYEILSSLGDGGQATVYLGRKNGQTFALKVYASGASKEAAYKIEADFLSKLKHSHLINMVDHRPQAKIKFNHRPEEKRPLLVLDLAEGGELFDYLSKTGKFSPELTRTYAKQLLSSIAYLAQVGITHRDLKPENILFNREFTLKVSDFGLARDAKGNLGNNQLSSRVGTEGYKAPEVELGNYEGLKADLFAAGVVIFIMYTGTPPFISTKSHDRIYRLIREKKYAKFWELHERNKPQGFYSESFKRLINCFLSAEPDRRPTFENLETDDWLQGNTLTQTELIAEMTSRAIKMGLKTISTPINLKQACNQSGSRCNLDLEDPQITKEQVFTHYYFKTHIDPKTLPTQDKENALYLDKDPKTIVSWINCFLFQMQKENHTFINDFVEQITFARYLVEYHPTSAQLKIKLDFELNNEEETELVLLANLYRSSEGKIGIDWIKLEGNSFWLSSVKEQINGSFINLI